ncbi:MAG: hybrid sensor histidine kinase/response regulator [bacterium]|nr:hybrid sensor histidine kinase/response regulator [bacterium]
MKSWAILCVDDEDIILNSLRRELTEALGRNYIIETANGGQEGLRLFEILLKQGYHVPVVIVDQIMPGMKGDDFLRKIHAIASDTLKIMLTGQADKQAVTRALNQADLYRYIDKPWEQIDLALTVKEAVRRYVHEKKLKHQNLLLRSLNSDLDAKVKERTLEIEKQQQELKTLNADKDKFFSIIDRDLRIPFSKLLGMTNALLRYKGEISATGMKKNLTDFKYSVERVSSLIENLLYWTQLQQGNMECRPETCSPAEIVEKNIHLLVSAVKQKGLNITNEIPHDIQTYADKAMLDTVLRNLLSNAIKFTPTGGLIALSAQRNGDSVELSVSDTGVGISQEYFPFLFDIEEKYYSVGTAGEEGSGVGLVLCRELLERNNGTIGVDSEVGHGSIFSIHLPAGSRLKSMKDAR